MNHRFARLICALCVFLLATVSGAWAAGSKEGAASAKAGGYPVKTVTLMTHSSPGGGSDLFLREMIKHLGPQMGVTFVVKNTTGSGGAKALTELIKSPADGSIFYATTPTILQTPMIAKTEFNIHDAEPMVNVFLDPMIAYVRADSPLKSLKDAVEAAKKNPGGAKWGTGTSTDLARQIVEQLKVMIGTDVRIASFEGGGDLMLSVLNGTVDMGVGEVAEMLPQLEAKKVRLITTFSETRVGRFPEVSTAREQGIDMVMTKFRGLTGPKGLPANVVKAWEEAIPKLLADPDYQKLYTNDSLVPAFMDQKTFKAYVDKTEAELKNFFVQMKVIK